MPSDTEIWDAIKRYMINKVHALQFNIDSIQGLSYDKICGEVTKNTKCDEDVFDSVFKKMQERGDVVKQGSEFVFYTLKGKEISFGKPVYPNLWKWGAGIYVLAVIFVTYNQIVNKPPTMDLSFFFLMTWGSLSVLVGGWIFSLGDKINEKARQLGKQYELPLTIVGFSLLLLFFVSTLYVIISLVLTGNIEISSTNIIAIIGISIGGAFTAAFGQRYLKGKNWEKKKG